MLNRYWRAAIAVGCGLALFVCPVAAALAQQPKQPALKGQPVPEAGQQQRAQDRKDDTAPKDKGTSELLSAIQGIEAAIRSHVAKEDKGESKRKEQREIDDLKAQQDMASWAKWMFWAAVASLVLTAVGVYLIYRTLGYTRDAAKAAADAVEEARKATAAAEETNNTVARNSYLELRAYVSVVPAGINELISTQLAMGHVDVRNVGKLPAREVSVHVRMRIHDREAALDPREDDFPIPEDRQIKAIDRTIQPGAEMTQGCQEEDLLFVGHLLQARDKYVYVWGVVYYSDGQQRRHTKFRHRYPIISHVRGVDWNQPAYATSEIITVDKARYDPYGNSAN